MELVQEESEVAFLGGKVMSKEQEDLPPATGIYATLSGAAVATCSLANGVWRWLQVCFCHSSALKLSPGPCRLCHMLLLGADSSHQATGLPARAGPCASAASARGRLSACSLEMHVGCSKSSVASSRTPLRQALCCMCIA